MTTQTPIERGCRVEIRSGSWSEHVGTVTATELADAAQWVWVRLEHYGEFRFPERMVRRI